MALTQITGDGLAPSGFPTGSVIQVKYFQLTTSQTETYGTANASQAITNFTVNITPTASNSVFKLDANLIYESANAPHSTMFFFFRDTTKLANTDSSPGNRIIGISPGLTSLDSNSESSFEQATLTYFDAPSTTSAIDYKLGVMGRTNNNFFINRTVDDTNTDSFDRGVSFMSVTEIAG